MRSGLGCKNAIMHVNGLVSTRLLISVNNNKNGSAFSIASVE